MKCIASNVVFISESTSEFTNDDGQLITRHRASFVQDGDDKVFSCQIDDSLVGCFVKLNTYDLDIQIITYNNRFYPKVIDYAEC